MGGGVLGVNRGVLRRGGGGDHLPGVVVYAIIDVRSAPTTRSVTPSRPSSGTRTPSVSSGRFAGDDPELASYLRIEERGARGGRAELGLLRRAWTERATEFLAAISPTLVAEPFARAS